MRSVFVALLLFTPGLFAEPDISASFEASYAKLQKKIGELKAKGDKVSEKTRKEIEDLMVQMNHEHTELKRQLEAKNQQVREEVRQNIDAGKQKSEDWSDRFSAAWHEIGGGVKRAWHKLKKDEP
jgi:hypothetical protein